MGNAGFISSTVVQNAGEKVVEDTPHITLASILLKGAAQLLLRREASPSPGHWPLEDSSPPNLQVAKIAYY